jgi:predicted metal-dependent enzyme (double-stranded beta helix superfamily)
MPEPVQVKNLLVGVYNEVERLRAHLQVSVASTAYKDVDELLQHFENAKDWLAQKVTQYDPDLGKELSSTQKPE